MLKDIIGKVFTYHQQDNKYEIVYCEDYNTKDQFKLLKNNELIKYEENIISSFNN